MSLILMAACIGCASWCAFDFIEAFASGNVKRAAFNFACCIANALAAIYVMINSRRIER